MRYRGAVAASSHYNLESGEKSKVILQIIRVWGHERHEDETLVT